MGGDKVRMTIHFVSSIIRHPSVAKVLHIFLNQALIVFSCATNIMQHGSFVIHIKRKSSTKVPYSRGSCESRCPSGKV